VRFAAATLVCGFAAAVGGCGPSDYTSSSLTTLAPASSRPSVSTKTRGTPSSTTTAPATSALGTLPPVLSSAPSPVDGNVITSVADLPAAFGCPKIPEPIVIPATATSPTAVVCRSSLAGEALYLWFAGDPDAKYLAVTAAMAKARYVRAGKRWVAGGMVDKQMGTVGGEVYKG